MMGDQSQCKALVGRISAWLEFCFSWLGKGGTVDFMTLPWRRIAIGLVITKRGVANAGELVGQCAGGLAVMGASLHGAGPCTQFIHGFARLLNHGGCPQHRASAMSQQHAQVPVALLTNVPEV